MQPEDNKTKAELLDELRKLRQRNSELEEEKAHFRQSEEIFRTNNAMLHALNQATTNLICVKDKQGKIIMANPAMLSFIGRSETEVVGKNDLDFLADAAQARKIRENDRRIMETRCPETIEETIDWPNRKWICLFNKSPYLDEHGEVIGVIGIGTDITERKQNEEALKKSEELYHTLIDSLSEGIILQEASGKITAWNRGAETIFNLKAEEVVGHTAAEYDWPTIHEDGTPYPAEQHPSMITLRTGQPLDNQTMGIKKPDGNIVWISINTRPVYNNGTTKPDAVVISFIDITERKRAEQVVKTTKDFLESVYNTTPDVIMVSDEKGYVTSVNKSVNKMLGFRPEQLIGKHTSELFPNDEKHNQIASEIITTLRAKGAIRRFDANWLRKDGRLCPIELNITMLQNKDGKRVGAVAAIRDMSERKRQEQGAREREERFRTLAESSNDAIITADSSGKILYWNKAAEAIYGYTAEEIVGKSIERLRPEGRRLTDRKNREKFLKTGQSNYVGKTIEGLACKKDGTLFLTETSTSYWTIGGQIIFCGIVRDITERKHMEAQLKKSHKELEKKVKLRTAELKKANDQLQISQEYLKKFAGMLLSAREEERKNISTALHDELGSMAIAVDSQISIAREECNENNKQATFTALTNAQTALRKAVADLRRLAVDLRPPNLDIMGLQAALTDLIDKAKENTKFKIIFRNETGDKKIPGETAIVIYRVIQEGLTNAIKHAKAQRVRVRLYSDRKNIHVDIADDGIGCDLNKVLFRKGKPSIGIAGMRERVDSLGGEFTITSAPKKGTQLKVALPKKL